MIKIKNISDKISKFFDDARKNKIIKKIIKDKEGKKGEANKKAEKEIKIKKSLAVDIGSSSIKIVQFSKIHGIAVLDTFGEIALGPFLDKPIGSPVEIDTKLAKEALGVILDASGADSFNVSYCVSPNQSFDYVFEYKKEKNKDINDVIIDDIKERYGVNISEYDIDYNDVTSQYDKNKKYEVIGVRKKIIEYNEEISKKLGLKLKSITFEAKSILYSIKHFFPNDYLIIDIGSSTTKIYMISKDSIYHYETIKIGTHDILRDFDFGEIDKEKEFIGDSINSLFSNEIYEKIKNNKQSKNLDIIIFKINEFLKKFEISESEFVEDIILTGGGALFNGLEDYFSDKLERKVIISDPFGKVKNPNFVSDKLKEVGPEYSAAIGLALEGLN